MPEDPPEPSDLDPGDPEFWEVVPERPSPENEFRIRELEEVRRGRISYIFAYGFWGVVVFRLLLIFFLEEKEGHIEPLLQFIDSFIDSILPLMGMLLGYYFSNEKPSIKSRGAEADRSKKRR